MFYKERHTVCRSTLRKGRVCASGKILLITLNLYLAFFIVDYYFCQSWACDVTNKTIWTSQQTYGGGVIIHKLSRGESCESTMPTMPTHGSTCYRILLVTQGHSIVRIARKVGEVILPHVIVVILFLCYIHNMPFAEVVTHKSYLITFCLFPKTGASCVCEYVSQQSLILYLGLYVFHRDLSDC